MSVLKVLRYGEESLRVPSKEVIKMTSKIQKVIDDLFDTMYSFNNGIGMAAPQLGYNYRIFVLDLAMEDEPRNPQVFINPKIVKKWGAVNSFEGCLSFPDVYINVRRYENIIVRAKDLKGKLFTLEANNGTLLARAIQHEYDHLDGNMFVDHARSREETNRILAEKGLPLIDPKYLMEEPELEQVIIDKERNKAKNEDNISRDAADCC